MMYEYLRLHLSYLCLYELNISENNYKQQISIVKFVSSLILLIFTCTTSVGVKENILKSSVYVNEALFKLSNICNVIVKCRTWVHVRCPFLRHGVRVGNWSCVGDVLPTRRHFYTSQNI